MTDGTKQQVRCCGKVPGEGRFGGLYPHRCTKNASVQRDGNPYCKAHDPVARQERLDKSDALFRQGMQEQADRENFNRATAALCKGVSVEKLKELGEGWLLRYLEARNELRPI